MADTQPSEQRLAELRQRWESDPASRVFLQLAEEHRRLGQVAEAISVLEKGLEHHQNSVSALGALGRCRLEVGEYDAAAAALEAVIQQDPTNMVAYRRLVDAHVGQRDAAAAIERLEMYAQLNTQDPEIGALRARIARIPPKTAVPSGPPAALAADVEVVAPDVPPAIAAPPDLAADVEIVAPDVPPVVDLPPTPEVPPPPPQIPMPLAEQMPVQPMVEEEESPMAVPPPAPEMLGTAGSVVQSSPVTEFPSADVAVPPPPDMAPQSPSTLDPVAERLPAAIPDFQNTAAENAPAEDAPPETAAAEAVTGGGLFAIGNRAGRPDLRGLKARPLRAVGRGGPSPPAWEVAPESPPAFSVAGPDTPAAAVPKATPALPVAGPEANAAAAFEAPPPPTVARPESAGAEFEATPTGPVSERAFTSPTLDSTMLDGPTTPIDVRRIRGLEGPTWPAVPPPPEPTESEPPEAEEEDQEPLPELTGTPSLEPRMVHDPSAVVPSSVENPVADSTPPRAIVLEPWTADPVPVPPPVSEPAVEGSSEASEAAISSSAPDDAPRADLAPPTATLGGLYLGQGHTREAKEIFEQVLARDPDNAAARDALDEVGTGGDDIQASELLAEYSDSADGGLSEKKAFVLEAYLARLNQGSKPDVS